MKRCLNCNTTFDGESWSCPSCRFTPGMKDGYLCFAPDLDGVSAFDESSYADLRDSLDRNFWFPHRNRLITWAFKKYFSNVGNYLEVGCGTGYVLKGIAECDPNITLTGTDIFTAGLVFAEQRLQGHAGFVQTNALNLPYRKEFDVVGAFDVIEHITDDVAALKELQAALKPGGGIMITVPRHMFLWSEVDTTAHHKRRYSGAELKSKVQSAGFDIVRQLCFGMITLPLQYISRRFMMNKNPKHSDVLELETGPLMGYGLSKLFEIDQIPIRWGVNYPFGGSLMVIARKA